MLFGDRQHQLDAVELIDFRRSRVAVNRHDIRPFVVASKTVDDAFARDVIRQTAEGCRQTTFGTPS